MTKIACRDFALTLAAALLLTVSGLATSPVSNLSFMVYSSNSGDGDTRSLAHLYVIDSQGRKSGYSAASINGSFDSTQDIVLGEIPHTDVGRESVDSDLSEDRGPENESVVLFPAPVGQYSMVVFSTVSYPVMYGFYISGLNSNGMPEGMTQEGRSFLLSGTTAAVTIDYDPTPGKVPVVTKAVSFPILRQEVQAAFQLKQVGGKRFVGELDDILAQGERALLGKDGHDDHRGDGGDSGKHEAVAKLREFIVRIESAAKPSKDHGGGRDRGQDRDRDDRRFATAVAAQSLTSDAKTLIEQLGGKPDGVDHDGREGHDGR